VGNSFAGAGSADISEVETAHRRLSQDITLFFTTHQWLTPASQITELFICRRKRDGVRKQKGGDRKQKEGGRRKSARSKKQKGGGRKQKEGGRKQKEGGRRKSARSEKQKGGGRQKNTIDRPLSRSSFSTAMSFSPDR
jgi:hypothetical protein